MARIPFLFEFDPVANPYSFDRGVSQEKIISRFFLPPDMTPAIATNLVALAGGRARTGNAVCPDAGFSPRKVTFIRANGNSFSIAIANRTLLTPDNLSAMRAVINGISPAAPVVCMKLDGEVIPNLIDTLRTEPVVLTPGVSSRPDAATAGIQYVHSGIINYNTDVILGTTVPLPVKVDTNTAAIDPVTGLLTTNPPAILGAGDANIWTTCVGAFVNSPTCGGGQPRSHRRYIADFVVADGAATRGQRTEIPITSALADEILNCGIAIAGLPALICLGYEGESNNRLHKTLPPLGALPGG